MRDDALPLISTDTRSYGAPTNEGGRDGDVDEDPLSQPDAQSLEKAAVVNDEVEIDVGDG